MNRRSLLKYLTLLGAGKFALGAAPLAAQAMGAPARRKPIVLYCDLAIDPAREQEMLDHYHNDFKPVAEKHDGYIDLKMVKIRSVISGYAPPKGVNYRFQLTYESEEKRQKWIASADHKKNWPLIENTVLDKNYQTLLTDVV
jgi:hypothetical protein